jgi:hypothetical protein
LDHHLGRFGSAHSFFQLVRNQRANAYFAGVLTAEVALCPPRDRAFTCGWAIKEHRDHRLCRCGNERSKRFGAAVRDDQQERETTFGRVDVSYLSFDWIGDLTFLTNASVIDPASIKDS